MLNRIGRTLLLPIAFAVTAMVMAPASSALAESGKGLREDSAAALEALYAQQPAAKALGEKAKAIVVFPNIVKAVFIVGGAYGEGVLIKSGNAVGYYSSVAASYGLQAGAQAFGYAVF